jgi:hypothetical protein
MPDSYNGSTIVLHTIGGGSIPTIPTILYAVGVIVAQVIPNHLDGERYLDSVPLWV